MDATIVAVVLAAGAGARFGGGKVLAMLEGRSLVGHVLEAVAAAGIPRALVVVPPGMTLDGATIVENPDPSRGLSSSVRVGVAAAVEEGASAILLALADQPRVSPSVIAVLLATDGPVVIPRYRDGSNPNPVLLRPPAFHLADEATGDRGLGPVLAAHPELVTEVAVDGSNPDVDTPDDLARIREWPERVP